VYARGAKQEGTKMNVNRIEIDQEQYEGEGESLEVNDSRQVMQGSNPGMWGGPCIPAGISRCE
jgi:hypothetical protein